MARTVKTRRNRISPSNLFLMELIISLLLFAVLSAACVTIFMKAHTMSEEAVLLSRGTDGLSSLAELIRGCDSPGEMMAAIAEATGSGATAQPSRRPAMAKDFDALELVYEKEVPVFEKYDEYVPEELVRKGFAQGVLDVAGMKQRVLSWEKFGGKPNGA